MTPRETRTRQAKMTAAARAGKEHAERPGPGWRTVLLRVAGAGLLIAAGAIRRRPAQPGPAGCDA
jgi:hypothetical protein